MKINFDLTIEDMVIWQNYYVKNHAPFVQKYLKWIIIIPFTFMSVMSISDFISGQDSMGELFVSIGLIGIFSFYLFRQGGIYARAMKKMIKNNPQLIGEREMEFKEESFSVRTSDSVMETQYNALAKWESTDEYEYLFKSKQVAFVIPRRVFADELEYQAFVDLMDGRLAQV